MRDLRRRAPYTSILLVATAFVASCEGRGGDESPDVESIAARIPEVASMIEEARVAVPAREGGAYAITSFPAASTEPGGWIVDARRVSLAVDEATGRIALTSARHLGIAAVPLDGGVRRASVEGSAIVQRDAAGTMRSIALARASGVEDLLVQSASDAPVGYELELPVGWSMRQPAGFDRVIEIRDPSGSPRLRLVADAAWDADGARTAVNAKLDGRRLVLSAAADANYPVVVDPEWQETSTPAKVRARSTATALADGRVLVIGGRAGNDDLLASSSEVLCSTELYDPSTRTWEAGPEVKDPGDAECTPLMDHVATPLPDGTVLVTGGANTAVRLGAGQPAALGDAWIYDPQARPPASPFTRVGPMVEPRVHHTATLLGSGEVLVVGGSDRQTPLQEIAGACSNVGEGPCERCVGKASAELFDPVSKTFTRKDMPVARSCHTATAIDDSSVLLIGGGGDPVDLAAGHIGKAVGSLTLYRDGAFTELSTHLLTPRFGHVAVLRPDRNEILVGFGRDQATMIKAPKVVAELLDVDAILSDAPPETGVAVCEPPTETTDAPSGVGAGPGPGAPGDGGGGAGGASSGGGDDASGGGGSGSQGGASSTGGGGAGGGDEPPPPTLPLCPEPRSYSTAVLSRSGLAYVVGGQDEQGQGTRATTIVDAFDFDAGEFLRPAPPQLVSPCSKPVLTMLPTGKLMVVGRTAPAELLDDTRWAFSHEAAALDAPRSWHRVTLLPDGKLLLTGGYSGVFGEEGGPAASRDTAEIFDPFKLTSKPVAAHMISRRLAHTATLVPAAAGHGPRVLLSGGMTSWKTLRREGYVATETAELFDPATGSFEPTGSMSTERAFHTATRLRDGKVLIVAGVRSKNVMLEPSAELYDPEAGTFSILPPPAVSRVMHTATLLPTGEVLIAGGFTEYGDLAEPAGEVASAEIFDPSTQTFRQTVGMIVPRGYHTATTLPSGEVLIAGGSIVTKVAEIFDPSTESFRPTVGSMHTLRMDSLGTALPNGKILISGGAEQVIAEAPRDDAELFDPVTEQFETILPFGEGVGRWDHVSALLPDGRVALMGGTTDGFGNHTTDAISIVEPIGSEVSPRANLLGGPAAVTPGFTYDVTGSTLSSFWEVSSGPYASPTGLPIAIWMPAEGAPVLGTFAPWSEGRATWKPGSTPYWGPGLLFAVRHGQMSVGLPIDVGLAPIGEPCSADAACGSGFCSDGVCCTERCHVAGDREAACRSCSVETGAKQDGICSAVDEGTDPHEDCEQAPQCAERFAVCGGNGLCLPCVCESKLDCAPGYECTAEGDCRKAAPEREDDGCSVSSDVGGGSSPWGSLTVFALGALALGVRARRRRVHARRPGGGIAHEPPSPERSAMRPEQLGARSVWRSGTSEDPFG